MADDTPCVFEPEDTFLGDCDQCTGISRGCTVEVELTFVGEAIDTYKIQECSNTIDPNFPDSPCLVTLNPPDACFYKLPETRYLTTRIKTSLVYISAGVVSAIAQKTSTYHPQYCDLDLYKEESSCLDPIVRYSSQVNDDGTATNVDNRSIDTCTYMWGDDGDINVTPIPGTVLCDGGFWNDDHTYYFEVWRDDCATPDYDFKIEIFLENAWTKGDCQTSATELASMFFPTTRPPADGTFNTVLLSHLTDPAYGDDCDLAEDPDDRTVRFGRWTRSELEVLEDGSGIARVNHIVARYSRGCQAGPIGYTLAPYIKCYATTLAGTGTCGGPYHRCMYYPGTITLVDYWFTPTSVGHWFTTGGGCNMFPLCYSRWSGGIWFTPPSPPAVPCMEALDLCNVAQVAAGEYETTNFIGIDGTFSVNCDTGGFGPTDYEKHCGTYATPPTITLYNFNVPDEGNIKGVAPDEGTTGFPCHDEECP